MKRVICLVIALIFIFTCCTSFAEEEFFPGTYRVGKDIKPGSYNIHMKKTKTNNPLASLETYSSEEDYKKGNSSDFLLFRTEGIHISAVDGMVFTIEIAGDAKLTIVAEKFSWMP